jgi:hypothetical protein
LFFASAMEYWASTLLPPPENASYLQHSYIYGHNQDHAYHYPSASRFLHKALWQSLLYFVVLGAP